MGKYDPNYLVKLVKLDLNNQLRIGYFYDKEIKYGYNVSFEAII